MNSDDLRARLADGHCDFCNVWHSGSCCHPRRPMPTTPYNAPQQAGGEVKCFRPTLQKSGQASKGYIAVMTAKPDPRDSDWRGEDSRQWVAFTDYAALQTDVARLRAALDCAAVNLGMEQLAREAAEAKLREAVRDASLLAAALDGAFAALDMAPHAGIAPLVQKYAITGAAE